MNEGIDVEIKKLEKEKLALEVKTLKYSKIRNGFIKSIPTLVTSFLIVGATWVLNKESISYALDVKHLKLEKESLEIELRKDSLSILAQKNYDYSLKLKKEIEIRDLKSRALNFSDLAMMESKLFTDFNNVINTYLDKKESNNLRNIFVTNSELIKNIDERYTILVFREENSDTLNKLLLNKLDLWKRVKSTLEQFGKISPEVSENTINKFLLEYKKLFDEHTNNLYNFHVDGITGKLQLVKFPERVS